LSCHSSQAQGLDPLLVGAAARDLLLVNVFGQRVRQATKDEIAEALLMLFLEGFGKSCEGVP